MSRLLMISGDRALAEGKHGAFYNTLEEFHKHWDRIDIICPRVNYNGSLLGGKDSHCNFFGNVFLHPSPWLLLFQPLWILREGFRITSIVNCKLKTENWAMTVHDYPPFYNGIGAWFLWRKIRVPYILEIMHIPGHPKSASIKEWFYKQYAKLLVRFDAMGARAVRVINQKQVPYFLTKYGVPREKLKYIPAFYIDLNIFKSLGLEKKFDLIFVGRLEKNKGLDILLDIAKISNLKILIVGGGSLREHIDKLIGKWKLANVKYFGFARDSAEVAHLINESRALIMLSYNEGGPRVVLEALVCGVPVIATRVGIVSEVINQNNGRIINWSVDEAIKAFEEVKNLRPHVDLSEFEKTFAIRNYADKIKDLMR